MQHTQVAPAGTGKKRSIHHTLLKAHLSTMLPAVAVIVAIFCVWQLGVLQKSVASDLHQTCRTVALNVDNELQRMDSTSINVLYSNLIRDQFASYSIETPESAPLPQAVAKNNSAAALTDLLTAIMGADRSVRQINLYNMDRGAFGSGMYNGFLDQNATEQPWYAQTMARSGYKYISQPAENPLLAQRGGGPRQLYLSLCRQYFNNFNQPEGFVEILQYYDVVFATAINPKGVYSPRVLIYSGEGEVMFPAEPDGLFRDYLPSRADGVVPIKNPMSGRKEYAVYGSLASSGFSVVVVLDSAQYYAPLVHFALSMLLVFAAVVLVGCISAYGVTRRICAPLAQIYDHLSGMDFQRHAWRPMLMQDSNIQEIDVLRDSINAFQDHLKQSMDSVLLLQRQELQSQMLALQSQTNPHFLYNSLATVSAMAEEGMTDEVGELCSNITAILRYISSNKHPMASLEEELENTDRYLHCLKLRFGEALTFSIDVPDEMLELPVPKLCVQLLVENAMKFTTPTAPPWHIEIRGILDTPRWTVTVLDNGPGFSPETLEKLSSKMQEIDKDKLLPNLELNGMGLMNIYIRLHLLYGTGFIFELGNQKPRGATVTIGGNINAADQTL